MGAPHPFCMGSEACLLMPTLRRMVWLLHRERWETTCGRMDCCLTNKHILFVFLSLKHFNGCEQGRSNTSIKSRKHQYENILYCVLYCMHDLGKKNVIYGKPYGHETVWPSTSYNFHDFQLKDLICDLCGFVSVLRNGMGNSSLKSLRHCEFVSAILAFVAAAVHNNILCVLSQDCSIVGTTQGPPTGGQPTPLFPWWREHFVPANNQ